MGCTTFCNVNVPASDGCTVPCHVPAGQELSRVAIPSRFTHDVARTGDDVFVCDTGNGRILQLSFPDMTPVSHHVAESGAAAACQLGS